MADLHIGKVVGSDDCDTTRTTLAIAPHDAEDRCQDGRRRFSYVGQAATCARLLLVGLAGTEEKSEPAR